MSDYDHDAERAAQEWLALADIVDTRGTWAAAASLFRNAVPHDEWARSLHAVRDPLGPVVARTLRSGHTAGELPGAPDGEYVVLEFDTQFARKRAAVETVTPMRDADGAWRVSGYYIR
jgi:hypothetical protein